MLRIEVCDVNGTAEHVFSAEEMRLANQDSGEVLDALLQIATGVADEVHIGGGAAAAFLLRKAA